MIDPVVIRFAAAGIADVSAAFARVGTQLRKFEEQSTRDGERGSRTRISAARNEEREKERAYSNLQKDAARLERQRTREADQEGKRREAIVRRSSEMAGREAEKAANLEIREAQRASRAVEREEARKMRIRIRSSEMAGNAAVREAAAEIKAAEAAATRRGAMARRVGGIAASSIGGLASSAVSLAGATLGIGGGMLLANAARQEMSAEKKAALLINSATIGGVVPEGADVASILGKAGAASKAFGVDRGEMIDAVQNYVAKSSDFKGGMENMSFFAKLSQGTGTKLEDITSAAGILRAQNKNLSGADMRQMLLDLTEQGKQGAVEISDMASLAGGFGSVRGIFQGSTTENQRKLLALGQITRTESVGAEEAMTSVKDLALEASAKQKDTGRTQGLESLFKAHGFKDVYDTKGRIKSPEALIEATLTSTEGRMDLFHKYFGNRGEKAFMRLAPIFNEAGGGDAGIAAVRKEMSPILNARGSMKQLDQMSDAVSGTSGEKLRRAFNDISVTLQDKLEPHLLHFANDTLPKLIPKFEAIISAADKFASWFADNPMKGLGTVVSLAIVKDLAGAGIGGAVAAAIVAAVTAAVVGINQDVSSQGKEQGDAVADNAGVVGEAAGLRRKVKAKTVTPQDLQKVQKHAQELELRQVKLAGGPDYSIGENILTNPAYGILGQTGAAKESRRIKEQENKRELEDTTSSLKILKDAAREASIALKAHHEAVNKIPPVKSPAPQVSIPQRPAF